MKRVVENSPGSQKFSISKLRIENKIRHVILETHR